MRQLDADAVAALGPAAAVRAITDALTGGLEPADDLARIPVDLTDGQFLLMPSQSAEAVGVKVITVAPENPDRGLPRVQGLYLLFEPETLTPSALLDGSALTTLRTPAVAVAAALPGLPDRPLRTVVLGAGPQGVAHAETLAAVRELSSVTYLVRDPERAAVPALDVASPAATEALAAADVVVCATTAREPLFDSSLLRENVVVLAVGSHEADARELDAALLARSRVVVEDVGAALREAGDVVLAIADGALEVDDLIPMRAWVTGERQAPDGRPLVVKIVGMPWQDLVIARAVLSLPG